MKLSNKRKEDVYGAIHKNMIDTRVAIIREAADYNTDKINDFSNSVDTKLFKIVDKIFKDILIALENQK